MNETLVAKIQIEHVNFLMVIDKVINITCVYYVYKLLCSLNQQCWQVIVVAKSLRG